MHVEITNAKKKNKELIKENKALKKQLDKNNFLILENRRLKNIMDIKEVDYLKKITARILIDAYKDIIPTLIKQKENPDYHLPISLPIEQNI